MAYVECGNGHVFDSDVNRSCPYCNSAVNRINFGGDAQGVGKTVASAGYAPAGEEIGATVAPSGYAGKSEDVGKTVGVFQKTMKLEPVVGWLVCIEGPDKGKDFRIYAKNNTIGRGEKMDICIKGDTTISRENHARLGYDDKHNNFHLIPGESSNNIYLNEEPVYVPAKLKIYDVIEFGDTKLLFIPFCNDKFTWKDGLKLGE